MISDFLPEAVIHYGEQPSAPVLGRSRQTAVETQQTNVIGTLNLLFSMREHVPDAHLIKLGTMGKYGTPNIDIEEGFIEIEHNGRKGHAALPAACLALPLLGFTTRPTSFRDPGLGLVPPTSTRKRRLRIETDETALGPGAGRPFDYDETFGTVLNRFCVRP